jgi:hypothetical protein
VTSPREHLIRLIERAGGLVEDGRYVTRPGCLLLAETRPTPEAEALFDELHLDPTRPAYERLGEFNGRITYLAFPEAPSSAAYNEALARKHQHLSVHGPTHVTLLLAGLSIEVAFELCSHREARVARLTTSRTRAMDDPLYRLFGTDEERRWQRAQLDLLLDQRRAAGDLREGSPDGRELFNRLDAGARATALTYTMSIKDFHTLFIGRLPPGGNEAELRDLCARMCSLLAPRYPLVLRPPEEYTAMNNGKKYEEA